MIIHACKCGCVAVFVKAEIDAQVLVVNVNDILIKEVGFHNCQQKRHISFIQLMQVE